MSECEGYPISAERLRMRADAGRIRQAMNDEAEACAQIAESVVGTPFSDEAERLIVEATAMGIAAAIRLRKESR